MLTNFKNMTDAELVSVVTNHQFDNTDRTTMVELVRELASRLEDILDTPPWEEEVHGGTEYNG